MQQILSGQEEKIKEGRYVNEENTEFNGGIIRMCGDPGALASVSDILLETEEG
jgi:DNA-binding GntR family transcriptional regulator